MLENRTLAWIREKLQHVAHVQPGDSAGDFGIEIGELSGR